LLCLTGTPLYIYICVKHFGMAKSKFVSSPAKTINLYKNTRSKLLKFWAKIYFNKQCLLKKGIPKYANLKFTSNSPVSKVTTKNAQVIRIKDEIKFLFKKKEKLNHDLYIFHTKAAQEWGSIWYNIHSSICEHFNYEMGKKYKLLDTKITKLFRTQTVTPNDETPQYIINIIKFCCVWLTLHCMSIYVC